MGSGGSRLFVFVFAVCLARSVAAATAPAATMASVPEGQLKATITAVQGLVQVREDENAAWVAAKTGIVLGQGAEFRTGPRSIVQFEIPPDQTITLDRLGVVKLVEAIKNRDRIKTDLGMQYGRVRYDIEAAGLDHDSVIRSPGSALAVRGTRVSLYDQPPFAPQATSFTGRAEYRAARKQPVALGGKGKGKAQVEGDASSAAQTALTDTILHSQILQLTDQELRDLSYLFTHQGRLLAGKVAISNTPVTDAELPGLISGNLDFVLRWSGPNHELEDLNMVVHTPGGKLFGNPPFILSLFPNDPHVQKILKDLPQSVPGIGQMGLNSIGPEGFEVASVGPNIAKGVYVLGIYNFIYSDKNVTPIGPKVPFTVEAFLHGKRQPLLLNLPEAVAGTQPPRFGLVYRDSVAMGELKGTAMEVGTGAFQSAAKRSEKPQSKTAPVERRKAQAAIAREVRGPRGGR